MPLNEYRKKRDFKVSPEPSGEKTRPKAPKSSLIYVIQKHRASHLHYDFRLEYRGTLLSWAIPKGPSVDPSVKRLAMQVEDHPVEYASFEGVIPEGEYGGGTVMVWDQGTWTPESPDVAAALEKGDLKFTLHGKKLKGSWVLVRTHGYGSSSKTSWLLIKHRDEFASGDVDVAQEMPRSAVSNRLLAEIARDAGGDFQKAATGDPILKPAKAANKVPKSSRSASAKNARQAFASKTIKARTTKRRKSSS
ncbi:MAG: bifunctional non-ous end joining protein LigD [Acidobacteriaceae bacterium]|nr:bifunctional non-ous end joining protein LigD [Acidobacteriaceae bacterium]